MTFKDIFFVVDPDQSSIREGIEKVSVCQVRTKKILNFFRRKAPDSTIWSSFLIGVQFYCSSMNRLKMSENFHMICVCWSSVISTDSINVCTIPLVS